MEDQFEDHRPGHNKENLAGQLISGRIGPGGNRTCHIHFNFTKVGGGGAAVDYLAREEEYKDRDDLEWLVGDPEAVKDAAQLVDEAAKVRNGPTAERVLAKITFELPAEMNSEHRKRTSERVVSRLKDRGFVAIAAVHCGGKEDVQPHIHVALTARPVRRTQMGRLFVDRDPVGMFCRGGRAVVKRERQEICNLVNAELGRELFHPGRLINTGIIDRPAQKRDTAKWRQRQGSENFTADDLARYKRQKQQERDANTKRIAEEKEAARIKRTARIDAAVRKIEGANYRIYDHDKVEGARKQAAAAREHDQKIFDEHYKTAIKERDQAKADFEHLVKKPPVPKRDADMEPASAKQIAWLTDLVRRKGAKWYDDEDDFPMTKGNVGAMIGKLKNMDYAPGMMTLKLIQKLDDPEVKANAIRVSQRVDSELPEDVRNKPKWLADQKLLNQVMIQRMKERGQDVSEFMQQKQKPKKKSGNVVDFTPKGKER
jgi:hypothetical protein